MSYIEDTKPGNFRYEFLLSIEQNAKRFWRNISIASIFLLVILSFIYFSNFFDKDSNYQTVSVSEIEQINSVLRFLVDKVKNQEAEAQEKLEAKKTAKVLSVHVPKANIREAPGFKSKKMMQVSEGVRLVHSRTVGEWHEVFTPHGVKAWVFGGVVK